MMARLLRGLGANIYAQGITALVQLLSVPLLVAVWGPARFGLWTLLTTVPATLAFADGGLVLAGGTAMTMLAARGDLATAAAVFRRMVGWVLAAVVLFGLGAVLAVQLVPAVLLTRGLQMPAEMARSLLVELAFVTLLGVIGALPGAAFRAGGRYASGTAAAATLRLAEVGAVMGGAWAGRGFGDAILAWGTVRLAGTMLLFAGARRAVPWLGCRAAPAEPVPALARSAGAALLLPACFAINLQGVTLAIGLASPPEAVAAFVAVRTLARLLVQATGLVTHALMPEMAAAAGRSDAASTIAILRLNGRAAALLLVPGWLTLLAAGPWVFARWTGGHLVLPAGTLPLVATAALLHGLWLSRANLLLAVDRQADYALAFLVTSLATAGLAGAAVLWAGLPGAAAATVLGEAAMAIHLAGLTRDKRPAMPLLAGAAAP